MKTFLKHFWKEVKPIVTLVLACVLFALISGFGIIANLYFSVKGCLQFKFWKGVQHFVVYWLRVAYQFWNCIKYLLNKLSVVVDLLGNVSSGELIEKATTTRNDTWFGQGLITLSASIGKEEKELALKPFGLYLTAILSKIFESGHSINAFDKKIIIDKFNKERGVKFDT